MRNIMHSGWANMLVFVLITLLGLQNLAEAQSDSKPVENAPVENHMETEPSGDWLSLPADSGFRFPLTSGWQVKVLDENSESSWERNATVPAAWEQDLGINFDGVAIYGRTCSKIESQLLSEQWQRLDKDLDHRLLLRLEGVATGATVRCNGQTVGQHVGAWTPWTCDLTDVWKREGENQLEVEVDELVGHHTQGFLPIVAPHFGGIWKPVTLELVPARRILKDESLVLGSWSEDQATIDFRLATSVPLQTGDQIEVHVKSPKRLEPLSLSAGNAVWLTTNGNDSIKRLSVDEMQLVDGVYQFSLPIGQPRLWSCDQPWLYDISVEIVSADQENKIKGASTCWFRTGLRNISTDGHRLLLNQKDLQVRGVLNWGYSPPSTAPTLSRADMLRELEVVDQMQANLMKFCLYIPPQEYLDLCDALGVLVWMEYPTWHAKLVSENLNALSGEYREFTNYDRNHPSVILRSLTCETGSSAELEVIQSLYDLVHDQVPNCVVEDDSSWISWNRVSDFWDDHPYGNNDTWVQTLDRLKKHIAANGAKPLLLGEAIAADTWPDLSSDRNSAKYPSELQYGFTEAAHFFESQLSEQLGKAAVPNLQSDSIRYASLMRQYQLETYRRELPFGGAVVSVIRDFPLASMGLIDQEGNFKFGNSDDRLQSPDATILLQTEQDRRSFHVGSEFEVTVYLLHPELTDRNEEEQVTVSIVQGDKVFSSQTVAVLPVTETADINSSDLHWQAKLILQTPSTLGPFVLKASAGQDSSDMTETTNQWKLWSVPEVDRDSRLKIALHASADRPEIRELLSDAGITQFVPFAGQGRQVIISRHWDLSLLQAVRAGAKVLMLPNGQRHSFVVADHWFLRGGPIVNPELNKVPAFADLDWRQLVVELQHFDLSGPVQKNFVDWQSTTPLVMLWDTHDIKEVKTHGLAWAARIGKGRLAVSTLNHSSDRSAVGPLMLQRMMQMLLDEENAHSWKSWSPELIERLENELKLVQLNLADHQWTLKPDPENNGLDLKWHMPTTKTDDWSPIRIDQHWEGQGHASLDGWAWYSCQVQVPTDWDTDKLYLCFTGVDDHYRAYVDGREIGSAGIIETKETAFEMRSSYLLPAEISPGDTIQIRIAVYDWYGSGGIFRPIYLRTSPLNDTPALLVK